MFRAPMPKTAIYKDSDPEPWEGDIGVAAELR
jgi:hypothetical protein